MPLQPRPTAGSFEDPNSWFVAPDDDGLRALAWPKPPLTNQAQSTDVGSPGSPSSRSSPRPSSFQGGDQMNPRGSYRQTGSRNSSAELSEKSAQHRGGRSLTGSVASSAIDAARISSEDGPRHIGSDSDGEHQERAGTEMRPRLEQQSSMFSQQSKFSDMFHTTGNARRGSITNAMRSLFGFGAASDVTTVQDLAAELFEFCLTICLSSAPDVLALVQAFGSDDKKSLHRLCATGKRAGLMGADPKSALPAPLSELARAFLAQGDEFPRPPNVSKASGSGLRSETTGTLGSHSLTSGETGFARGFSKQMPKRQVTFDQEDRGGNGMLRQGSAQGAMLDNSTTMGKVLMFNRSMSDLSCTSFSDFNRRNMGQRSSMPGAAVRLTFLDFLTSLHANQTMAAEVAPPEPSNPGMNLVRPGGVLDTVSEAGMSYHSAYDMEGEREVMSTIKAVNLPGGVQGRLGFKTNCLRTENAYQKQLLFAQTALVNNLSTKLKAQEKELHSGDQLRDEQKELLRTFRKIIVRECGDEHSKPFSIYIVEKDDDVRKELGQNCGLLKCTYQAFRSFRSLVEAIKNEGMPNPITRIESDKSKSSFNGFGHQVEHMKSDEASNEDKLGYKALEGRADTVHDWRSRALLPPTTKKASGSKSYLRTGSTATEEPEILRVVILGYCCLEKDLPKDWLKSDNIFVVLTSQADEYQRVGEFLLASSEPEIREKLRERGVQEYLLHPLSLDCMRKAVNQALQRRYGDEYLLITAMGRGTSGVVHRAKRLRDGGVFALKEINTRRMSKTAREEVARESQLLQELRWPTVLFLVDTWENSTDRLRYILMPLLESGSLQQMIENYAKESDKKPGPERIAEWYAQTLHGLCYLHWRGVLHRDMKPGNLLLAGEDGRGLQIGDLGSAALLPGYGPHPMKRNTLKGNVCTPLYSPPEVLLEETWSVGSDMWAVGASFFEVVTSQTFLTSGQASIRDFQEQARAYDWRNGPWQEQLSKTRGTLPPVTDLPELMRRDPFQRPSASDLAGHPVTSKHLKAVLSAGALVSSHDRKLHFEDFARVRSESDKAAPLDVGAINKVRPLELGPQSKPTSPASSDFQSPFAGSRTTPGSSPSGAGSIRSAAGGLARAGGGLMRASSGAVNWAKGGRPSAEHARV